MFYFVSLLHAGLSPSLQKNKDGLNMESLATARQFSIEHGWAVLHSKGKYFQAFYLSFTVKY